MDAAIARAQANAYGNVSVTSALPISDIQGNKSQPLLRQVTLPDFPVAH
jgi:hypothetical protein